MTRCCLAASLALGAQVLAFSSASAQLAIPGSDKETLAILSGGTSVDLDVSQAKLGLNLNQEVACVGKKGRAREMCLGDVNRDHWNIAGRFAAAAQEGKRSLIAGGAITPGLELGGSITRTWESEPSGYRAAILYLKSKLSEVKFAEFNDGAARLGSAAEKSLTLGATYVDGISESLLLAVSASVQRNWDSPGLRKPIQVCVPKGSGVDSAGATIVASKCEDRVPGALGDETVWQPRLEFERHWARDSSASFGLVGSFAPALRSGTRTTLNATIGPTLHPPGRPREVLAAVLFTFSDITDANDRDLSFDDIFSLRLYLALPLTGF